jgi:hypothetical protein
MVKMGSARLADTGLNPLEVEGCGLEASGVRVVVVKADD